MSLKFTKIIQGRKRLIKTQATEDLANWPSSLSQLKRTLSLSSGYQVVGHKVLFEICEEASGPKMMLEVIGLPLPGLENGLVIVDQEACEVLVHKLLGYDLFTIDYDQLLATSLRLKQTLEASFREDLVELSSFFHIVFAQDKIELHFFRQKDYIQKQF